MTALRVAWVPRLPEDGDDGRRKRGRAGERGARPCPGVRPAAADGGPPTRPRPRPRRRRGAGHGRGALRPLGRHRLADQLRRAPGGAGPRPRRAQRRRQRGQGAAARRRGDPVQRRSSSARSGCWPSGSSCPRRRCAPTPSPPWRGWSPRWTRPRSRSSPACSGRCTPGRGRCEADTAGLERLRELNRRYPLVFLPSHRSYVDPLVLADVLAQHDFPRNHVLGGDNLRFWPLGSLAKRAGHRVHPAQLRRRPGLQARRPGVLRLPAGQALQPRVVHGGRPLADRQAPPAPARAAALRRRRRRAGPGGRRLPRARLDHLRPAARGVADGRRAGRRRQAGGGAVLARVLRPRAADAPRWAPSTSASPSRCRWPRRCRPAPTRTIRTPGG